MPPVNARGVANGLQPHACTRAIARRRWRAAAASTTNRPAAAIAIEAGSGMVATWPGVPGLSINGLGSVSGAVSKDVDRPPRSSGRRQ